MPDTPPNLLFIFTDEQRRDTLACYGNTQVQMPCLNRFAESACVIDDAHCVHPVCTPSRGTMMTGLYPHQHGAIDNNVPLNPDARCLPELMPETVRQQYRIEYHGKWHLGDELFAQHGYERFISIEDMYAKHFSAARDPSARSSYHHFLLDEGFTLGRESGFNRSMSARLPERYGKPKFLADRASAFIRENAHRPWMLTVNFLEPHMPFFGPRDGQYDPDAIDLFPNADHWPGQDTPQRLRDKAEHIRDHRHEGFTLRSETDWRQITANYLGLCSLIDTHTGRILETLRDCRLDDNTIVVFTSDHGEMMGSHHLLAKNNLYRESTRVPWLVRLPGQSKQARLTGPTSHIDLVPTLLDLLGQPVTEHLPGRSLAETMRAAADGGGEHSVAETASPCVIVQTDTTRTLVSPDGWRYTAYLDTGEQEFYDHRVDPMERENRAHRADATDTIQAAKEQLRDWQRQTNDIAPAVDAIADSQA